MTRGAAVSMLLLAAACGNGPDKSSDGGSSLDAASDDVSQSDASASDGGSPPALLRGVTIDAIDPLPDIVTALSALPHKPTTCIVFDETQAPSYYAQAVPAVHAVSYVMGEILDSLYVSQTSVTDYVQRAKDYVAAFPAEVDLWEVGNEINGNWVDTSSGGVADVVAKMAGAFDAVQAAGGHTELTLYGCSDSDASHDLVAWANANVPSRMRTGLDYVLVSYYEGDCAAPRSDWPAVFAALRQIFPSAGLGFGETGAVDANGNDITDPLIAGPYLQKYYGMQISVPGWVGGYFWWYFAEDMVPDTKPMFPILAGAMQ